MLKNVGMNWRILKSFLNIFWFILLNIKPALKDKPINTFTGQTNTDFKFLGFELTLNDLSIDPKIVKIALERIPKFANNVKMTKS